MEWQPIETAPKDGTTILVYLANGDVHTAYGHFYNKGHDFEWAQYGGYETYLPTHWMPLPPPPNQSAPSPE